MAFADIIRSKTWTANDIATLIENLFVSGYPLTWTAWTPTFSASGSMTFTGVTYTAKYIQIGKLLIFFIDCSGTTGGVASTALRFTLPVARSGANYFAVGGGYAKDSSWIACYANGSASTTVVDVNRYDAGNYSLAASRGFSVFGAYEAA